MPSRRTRKWSCRRPLTGVGPGRYREVHLPEALNRSRRKQVAESIKPLCGWFGVR